MASTVGFKKHLYGTWSQHPFLDFKGIKQTSSFLAVWKTPGYLGRTDAEFFEYFTRNQD